MDKKVLRNDLILILSLLLVAVVSLIVVNVTGSKKNLVANVYYQNTLVTTLDLENDEGKEYSFGVWGDKSPDPYDKPDVITVSVKNHAVAITESPCPHQDCVHMGYVSDTNHPIICAYYGIYISIEGDATTYDTELG